jgi:hypothetical protein
MAGAFGFGLAVGIGCGMTFGVGMGSASTSSKKAKKQLEKAISDNAISVVSSDGKNYRQSNCLIYWKRSTKGITEKT